MYNKAEVDLAYHVAQVCTLIKSSEVRFENCKYILSDIEYVMKNMKN